MILDTLTSSQSFSFDPAHPTPPAFYAGQRAFRFRSKKTPHTPHHSRDSDFACRFRPFRHTIRSFVVGRFLNSAHHEYRSRPFPFSKLSRLSRFASELLPMGLYPLRLHHATKSL